MADSSRVKGGRETIPKATEGTVKIRIKHRQSACLKARLGKKEGKAQALNAIGGLENADGAVKER